MFIKLADTPPAHADSAVTLADNAINDTCIPRFAKDYAPSPLDKPKVGNVRKMNISVVFFTPTTLGR
ncbi:hypothetical protein R9C00_15825 [Flammeovirgaceae bacterium SG7u.111]|nr:hypothetical protein [Flammeovirgaceae bacterium SG7u.132]WPO33171.1 hypothetical protein R9C00_15825 [Flammeovirgaceae bacterium SG7u.111]